METVTNLDGTYTLIPTKYEVCLNLWCYYCHFKNDEEKCFNPYKRDEYIESGWEE